MKKLTVAISAVAASVLMAMSAQAAEIYNKDSNKLDLYGKVNAKHYFSSNDADDGDTTYARLGFKGETQWICPYISRHLLSLNPLLACCRRYSRGER